LFNIRLLNTAFFYIFLLILSYSCTSIRTIPDLDIWARLAVGSIFLQTGNLLSKDIFSFMPVKDVFIDHEWGSSVIFYIVAKYFGGMGLFWLKFILIFAIWLLIAKTIRLNEKVKRLNVLLFIFAAMPVAHMFFSTIRCLIFTYLFFCLWIYVLERARKGENRLLWIIPVTAIIWANMHAGFVSGLGLLFLYAAGEFLNKKNPIKYIITLLMCTAAVFINPYGYKYFIFLGQALTTDRSFVTEWAGYNPLSLSLPSVQLAIFIVVTLSAVIFNIKNNFKADRVRYLLLAATFILVLMHVRHTVFFVIVSLTFFYNDYIELFSTVGRIIHNKFGSKFFNGVLFSIKSLSFLLVAYMAYVYCTILPPALYVNPAYYPVGSIQFILQNNIKGNLYVPWDWGSYAFWKLYPNNLISTDGRYEETYSEEIFKEARNFTLIGKDYKASFLKKYHTDVILLPNKLISGSYIQEIPNWKLVYSDNVSRVYLPNSYQTNQLLSPDFRSEIYITEDYGKPVNLN